MNSLTHLYEFADLLVQIKDNVDPVEGDIYVQGQHMATDQLHISKHGVAGDGYLGPAFTRKFRRGDILFGSRRTYLRKIARTEFDGITSNTTFVFRKMNDSVYCKLAPFAMYNQSFISHTIQKSRGSTNPYILYSDFEKFPLISKQIQNPEKLLSFFENNELTINRYSELLEHINRCLNNFTKEVNSIESGFVPLGELIDLKMGVSPPGKDITSEGEYRFLQGGADFGEKYPQSEVYTNDDKKLTNIGDILMTVRAPVGELSISDQIYRIGRGVAAITPRAINPDYLFCHLLLHQIHWRKREQGSTFLAVNKQDILEYPVTLLNSEHQIRIARKYTSLFDLRIKTLEQISNLMLLRRIVASKVF